jgi:hypothetical protein
MLHLVTFKAVESFSHNFIWKPSYQGSYQYKIFKFLRQYQGGIHTNVLGERNLST